MPPHKHAPKPVTDTSVLSAGNLFQTRPFQPDVNNVQQPLQRKEETAALTGGFDLTKIQYDSSPPPISPLAQPLQAKLTIGEPNDKYEQEADRVAHDVVQRIHAGGGANDTQHSSEQPQTNSLMANPIHPLQRAAMREEKERLQKKSLADMQRFAAGAGAASAEVEQGINSARGSGQSLAPKLQAQMGQAMGSDFSGVRVHTDARSDQLNRSIQAKAFTTGQDIFFRQGAYQPESRGGQELIAHELTHVVQQNSGALRVQRTIEIISSNSDMTPEDVLARYQAQAEAQYTWDKQKRDSDRDKERPSTRRGWKPTPEPQGLRPPDPVTPLVAIGDVYTGVTQTGQDTWPGLVRQLYAAVGKEQSSLFTVFTGTHGQIGGQYLDSEGRIDVMYKDASHTVQDKVRRDQLVGEIDGCDIKVLDIFEEGLTKPEDLRNAVKAEVAKDRVVILAWCFSVEAFKAVPENIPPIGRGQGPDGEDIHSDEEYEYVANRQRVTIKDIVSDSFGSDLSGYSRKQHPKLQGIDMVTTELVEQLIAANNKEALGTLFTSDRFPLGRWESGAWAAFQDWLLN